VQGTGNYFVIDGQLGALSMIGVGSMISTKFVMISIDLIVAQLIGEWHSVLYSRKGLNVKSIRSCYSVQELAFGIWHILPLRAMTTEQRCYVSGRFVLPLKFDITSQT